MKGGEWVMDTAVRMVHAEGAAADAAKGPLVGGNCPSNWLWPQDDKQFCGQGNRRSLGFPQPTPAQKTRFIPSLMHPSATANAGS